MINKIIFGNCLYGNYMIKDHIKSIIIKIPDDIILGGIHSIIDYINSECISFTEKYMDNLFIINSSLLRFDDHNLLFTGDLVSSEDLTKDLNL